MSVIGTCSLLTPVFWLSLQEYLRLSDVYKMYGNASVQPHSSSPAALHCLSLAVAPCEVDGPPAFCLNTEPTYAHWQRKKNLSYRCSFLTFFSTFFALPACVCMKEYITVSQLSQIFGMQRLDPTSSSSTPSFQLASTESTFSCHSTACGPSSFLSAQVCYSLLFPTSKLSTERFLNTFMFPTCSMLLSLLPSLLSGWMLFITSEPARAEQERNASH